MAKKQGKLAGMPAEILIWPDEIGGRKVEDLGIRFGGVVLVSHDRLGALLGQLTAPHGNRMRLTIDVVATGHTDKVAVKSGQSSRLTVIAMLQVETIRDVKFLSSAKALEDADLPVPDPDAVDPGEVAEDELTAARAARVRDDEGEKE